jgi:hypothetical protein
MAIRETFSIDEVNRRLSPEVEQTFPPIKATMADASRERRPHNDSVV